MNNIVNTDNFEDDINYELYLINELKKYRKNINEYKKFIKEASILLSSISLSNNSVSLSIALTRLIEMGVFSINDKFIHKNVDEIFYLEPGMQVVNGVGVCRNTAGFQKNIFEELNIPIESFTCIMDDNYIESTLVGDANHIANVITYNGILYLSDVFNDMLGSFISESVAKTFSDSYYYYKPDFLLDFSYLKVPDMLIRLEKYEESSFKSQITINEYNEIKDDTLKSIISKAKLLTEFRNDTRGLKEKIIKKSK